MIFNKKNDTIIVYMFEYSLILYFTRMSNCFVKLNLLMLYCCVVLCYAHIYSTIGFSLFALLKIYNKLDNMKTIFLHSTYL